MERVTKTMLHNMIDNLNRMNAGKGQQLALDIAYGGYRLVKITNPGGGERDLSYRMTAKEMYFVLDALENTLR